MTTDTKQKRASLIGWILSGLLSLFLLFDGISKVIMAPQVLEYNVKLGYPDSTTIGIGLALVISTIIYMIPKTSILGAILLTGYLGGATATSVRVLQPFLFPVFFGILIWITIYLREKPFRMLFPFKLNRFD